MAQKTKKRFQELLNDGYFGTLPDRYYEDKKLWRYQRGDLLRRFFPDDFEKYYQQWKSQPE